ncbi:unnamed protein product, partial [Scytosiphon promiscuus]
TGDSSEARERLLLQPRPARPVDLFGTLQEMSVSLDVSSDIIGGVLGIALAAVIHTVSVYVFPRLLGKSQFDAVLCGERVEASVKSMARIRNRLGTWAWLLTVIVHLLAFTLEFGLKGVTMSVENEQPAVILGGGPRYSEPRTTAEDGSSLTFTFS